MEKHQERLRKNLKRKIKESGDTIESVAVGANVHTSTIWRLLNYKCDPKLSTLVNIARHLKTDLAELFSKAEGEA